MNNKKVVSIAHRFEQWKKAFDSNDITVSISSHGRMRIKAGGGDIVILPLVEATSFLGRVSEVLENEMNSDTFASL